MAWILEDKEQKTPEGRWVFEEEDSAPSLLSEMGPDFLKGVSRAGGIAVGILNSPLAFIWGSQTEQYRKPEEWKKLPGWKKQLVSVGAGFESAYRSAFKKGDWGTLYGEYYKGVTGVTIEEDMTRAFRRIGVPDPERLASDLAPTAEALANIVSDPLITFGEAGRIARLRLPKTIPQKMLDRIAALNKAEKRELQRQLLTALKRRKEYKGTIDKLRIAQEARKPPELGITPKKKIPVEIKPTTPLKSGVTVTKFREEMAKKTAASFPEHGLKYNGMYEAGIYSFTPQKGPLKKKTFTVRHPTVERVKAELKAVEKRFAVPDLTPNEIAAILTGKKITPGVKFAKGITKPTTLKAAGGVFFGIEEDEDGNIGYNPKRALTGTLLMAAGMKIKPASVKRFAQTMKSNPAWAKVVSGIKKEGATLPTLSGIITKLNVGLFDRFAVLKKVTPKTYEAARKFSSYKDNTVIKFKELQVALRGLVDKNEFIFTSYIKAHRDLTRAERGFANPGGVTLDDARQAIKEIESHWVKRGKNIEDLRDARDLWNQWTHDHILWEAKENGIISAAAYDDILKNNKWYATYDVLDYLPENVHNLPAMSATEYFNVLNQNIIKRLKGTERQISDPIEATVRKFANAQGTFARNKVVRMLVEDPQMQPLLQRVAMNPKELKKMREAGLDPILNGTWNKKYFDSLGSFKDGELERWLVPRELADAMKQLTPYQAPRFIQAYNAVFRAAATTLRLAFAIGNAARDAFMAYTTVPVYKWHHILGGFQKDWVKGAWQGILHEVGRPSLVDDYIKAGGGFGYAGAEAFERGRPAIRKAQLFEKSLIRKGITVITSPLTLMEKINSVIELAPRLGTFERAMRVGSSIDSAAMMARQATIDFNRGGIWSKMVNQFVPFINARIGARVVMYEALKNNPKQTLAKAAVLTVPAGLGLYAWNRLYYGDLYDDIPEYIKQNYFTFIYGQTKDEKGAIVPKYFVVAKGDVGAMAWNPIEFALEQEWKKDPSSVTKFFINALSDLSPVEFAHEGRISLSKAGGGLIPPIAKAPIEDWANLKFYQGTEIVPHYMGKTKPPELQYRDTTPESYKWLGKKLGIAPLRIQNYMSNVVAGYGREGFSPKAMLDGIKGRIVKTQGGAVQQRAFIAIKNMEVGYTTARAYAEELSKDGQRSDAIKLLREWNRGFMKVIDEYNVEFKKYGFQDRGPLRKSYTFTADKILNILAKRTKKERPAIEKRVRGK